METIVVNLNDEKSMAELAERFNVSVNLIRSALERFSKMIAGDFEETLIEVAEELRQLKQKLADTDVEPSRPIHDARSVSPWWAVLDPQRPVQIASSYG